MFRRVFPAIVALLLVAAAPARAVMSYSTMAGRLAELAARCDSIKVYNLGKAASGNRSVWAVSVGDPHVEPRTTTRILILCRQHGDEPVSTEAALGFLERVAAGTAPGVPQALKHTTVYIVPMVNPDGADALTRRNANGVDLNRDWGAFTAPETQLAYRLFKAVRPQFVIDMHSWDKEDPYRANCTEVPRTQSPLASAIRDLDERATQDVGTGTGQPLSQIAYDDGADRSLCHRYVVETLRTPAILFETTAGMDEGDDFTRRVDLARAMILWLVRDTAANPDAWRNVAHVANSPTPRPTFQIGVGSTATAALAVATDVPQKASQSLAIQPFRLPRTLWWALGMYAIVAVCIYSLKYCGVDRGYVHFERVVQPNGKTLSTGVYRSCDRIVRPQLTVTPTKRLH